MLNKIKKYFWVVIPLIGGALISIFLKFNIYNSIIKPPLAPPKILFPIAWSILYILMGIVLYILVNNKEKSLIILFIIQLIFNYIWPFIFFNLESFFTSFIVIVLLDFFVLLLILSCADRFRKCSYLLIPYFIWICFATYLNWTIFLLN